MTQELPKPINLPQPSSSTKKPRKRRKRPTQRHYQAKWDKAKTLYFTGIPLLQVSKSMNIPYRTLHRKGKQMGWKKQRTDAYELVKNNQEVAQANGNDEALLAQRGLLADKHIGKMIRISGKVVDALDTEPDAYTILKQMDKVNILDKVARRQLGLNEGQSEQENVVNVGVLSNYNPNG